MIISTDKFRKACSLVLSATDTSELSTITETLELYTAGDILYLNVTNKEYFVSIKFEIDACEEFKATVNANLFLKLIAAITTETIELQRCDNYLFIKGNGEYKLPLIFENDQLMTLPQIIIDNPTVDMKISSAVLDSINMYNSKQLNLGVAVKAVQKLFYLDENGCITFVSGACVNNFTLPCAIKLLLNNRIVSLFKLFKNEDVKFTLGYDCLDNGIMQTKVRFESEQVTLTAITSCNDELLNQVPVNAIRNRANKQYDNIAVLSTQALSQAINRLLLFSAGYGTKQNLKPYSTFKFDNNCVTIYDSDKNNFETLVYQNDTNITEPQEIILDLTDLKKLLDGYSEQYLTLNFGDHQACVIAYNNIRNVIPEIHQV